MEADFARYYGIDLAGLWRGEITPRRAAVLAMHLPAGAQTWASCGWDSAWTVAEHLAARNGDILAAANWQRSEGKGSQPKPLPRPGDDARADSDRARMELRAQAFTARQKALQRPLEGDAGLAAHPDAPEGSSHVG